MCVESGVVIIVDKIVSVFIGEFYADVERFSVVFGGPCHFLLNYKVGIGRLGDRYRYLGKSVHHVARRTGSASFGVEYAERMFGEIVCFTARRLQIIPQVDVFTDRSVYAAYIAYEFSVKEYPEVVVSEEQVFERSAIAFIKLELDVIAHRVIRVVPLAVVGCGQSGIIFSVIISRSLASVRCEVIPGLVNVGITFSEKRVSSRHVAQPVQREKAVCIDIGIRLPLIITIHSTRMEETVKVCRSDFLRSTVDSAENVHIAEALELERRAFIHVVLACLLRISEDVGSGKTIVPDKAAVFVQTGDKPEHNAFIVVGVVLVDKVVVSISGGFPQQLVQRVSIWRVPAACSISVAESVFDAGWRVVDGAVDTDLIRIRIDRIIAGSRNACVSIAVASVCRFIILAVRNVHVLERRRVVESGFGRIVYKTDDSIAVDVDRVSAGGSLGFGEYDIVNIGIHVPVFRICAAGGFAGFQHPDRGKLIVSVFLEDINILKSGGRIVAEFS